MATIEPDQQQATSTVDKKPKEVTAAEQELVNQLVSDIFSGAARKKAVEKRKKEGSEAAHQPGQDLLEATELTNDVDEQVLSSQKLLENADELVEAPPPQEQPQEEEEPISEELIEAALGPILEYPTELGTDNWKHAQKYIQESDTRHEDVQQVARKRIAENRAAVAELVTQLQGPNEQYRADLAKRRERLNQRRGQINKRKELLDQDIHDKFEAQVGKGLEFHATLDAKRTGNEEKQERVRLLKQQIKDSRLLIEKDQKEQDLFLEEGQKLLAKYSQSRLAMFKRLHEQVFPSLLTDAQLLQEAIGEVAKKDQLVVREARRQLVEKRDQIKRVISAQTSQMKSLNYTVSILKRENEAAKRLAEGQSRYHDEGKRRLQLLKKGVVLRKYHINKKGRTATRFVSLSDDATFLYYSKDNQRKRKFKKYRIANIQNVLVGPASSTFRKMKLNKQDTPTRLFSILFEDQRTIDFAVPNTTETLTPVQYGALSEVEKNLYSQKGNVFEKDVTDTVYESLVLGLLELITVYNTEELPTFTRDKLRWMQLMVNTTMKNYKNKSVTENDLSRKHLRRLFGYKYYESVFEVVQATTEESAFATQHTIDVVRQVRVDLSDEEDNKEVMIDNIRFDEFGEGLTHRQHTQEDEEGVGGFVSDQLRKQHSNSALFGAGERKKKGSVAAARGGVAEEKEAEKVVVEEQKQVGEEKAESEEGSDDESEEESEEGSDDEESGSEEGSDDEESGSEEGSDDESGSEESSSDGESGSGSGSGSGSVSDSSSLSESDNDQPADK